MSEHTVRGEGRHTYFDHTINLIHHGITLFDRRGMKFSGDSVVMDPGRVMFKCLDYFVDDNTMDMAFMTIREHTIHAILYDELDLWS